ncbi:serine/threonine protein kinase [Skermania sp. ID1734]|uniref:serine/threonine-protein kinase n=1 Tax=Skermania sp. ID1734 TaxID=2597516 RepID=UPI001181010D|nr:serine/threonine-protein kinase [Skermania sp. ID1734]TSE02071.1 serine/threonine protein kinase [Skermania sp. ID1734]
MSERQQTGHHPAVGPDYLVAGRYRLQAKLGGGGMGTVWLAHDKLLDRDVAIKQITSTTGLGTEAATRLRNRVLHEGRTAAKLSHHHAIAMYDVALDGGEPWLVMEHLPSRSLAQALTVVDAIPPFEVAQIGTQVADALSEAHAVGILHRDIKPGNILIADRGRHVGTVKISDFGIARAKGENDEPDGVITGTPAYLAPEVARGDDPTEASDVFSLGATLYTAVEGQPPFGIDTDSHALLERVARAEIIAPQRADFLTEPLLHMLEPDPARRPTMAQARDELAAAAATNADYLLGAPIHEATGNVPHWALRSAIGRSRPRPAPTLVADTRPATHVGFDRNWTATPPRAMPQRISAPGRTRDTQTNLLHMTLVAGVLVAVIVAIVAVVLALS